MPLYGLLQYLQTTSFKNCFLNIYILFFSSVYMLANSLILKPPFNDYPPKAICISSEQINVPFPWNQRVLLLLIQYNWVRPSKLAIKRKMDQAPSDHHNSPSAQFLFRSTTTFFHFPQWSGELTHIQSKNIYKEG